MKKLSILMLSGVAFLAGNAEQISESQAEAVASKYLNVGAGRQHLLRAQVKNQASESPYYVFNSTSGPGFVIISGDDEMTELVGYSTTGHFDPSNVPSNMQNWLDSYAAYVDRVQNGEAKAYKRTVKAGTPVVGPLVKTKWNQDAPYNNLCPADRGVSGSPRSYTGCVATAMAQVMYYHKWPETGKGKKGYTSSTINKYLSVDFSQSTYDWENMQLIYNGDETPEQNNAVARLMYDCGVAVNMNYTAREGSGAADMDIPIGLGSHFGYKSQIYLRDAYSAAGFFSIIKNEIDNNRPLLFAGQGSGGGHEFVIDGYDTNNFLSVNWGWGGVSDGFFDMNLMNPDDLGAGGGAGGFSEFQSIVTMEKDPTMTGDQGQKVLMLLPTEFGGSDYGYVKASRDSYQKGESIDFAVRYVWNAGTERYNGQVAVAVYDKDYKQVAISSDRSVTIMGSYMTEPQQYTISGSSLSALPDGIYSVWVVSKERITGKTFDWMRVASTDYVQMNVADGNVTFGIGEVQVSVAGTLGISKTPLYPGDKVDFTIQVRNNGAVALDGKSVLELKDASTGGLVMQKGQNVKLTEGVANEINIPITLSKSAFKAGKTYRVEVVGLIIDGKTYDVTMPLEGFEFKVDDPSGVDDLNSEGVEIAGGVGEIVVNGAERVEIYTVGGSLISRATREEVPSGLYIVKADGVVKKVVVK